MFGPSMNTVMQALSLKQEIKSTKQHNMLKTQKTDGCYKIQFLDADADANAKQNNLGNHQKFINRISR